MCCLINLVQILPIKKSKTTNSFYGYDVSKKALSNDFIQYSRLYHPTQPFLPI